MKPETELEVFGKLGGTFVTPVGTLVERARALRGLVCDWDGVFNHGAKGEGADSTYSEPDSMGTNLLRYALWRKNGELPIAALITGADNPSARTFAVREHFHAIYYGSRNKTASIEALCRTHNCSSERLVCSSAFSTTSTISVWPSHAAFASTCSAARARCCGSTWCGRACATT
jgi:hypothetical protein